MMLTSVKQFIIPVYLVEKNQINSIFIRANFFLLTKFKDYFYGLSTDSEKIKKLKELWMQEFSAELIDSNSFVSDISFKNKEQMMIFLLRWS